MKKIPRPWRQNEYYNLQFDTVMDMDFRSGEYYIHVIRCQMQIDKEEKWFVVEEQGYDPPLLFQLTEEEFIKKYGSPIPDDARKQ